MAKDSTQRNDPVLCPACHAVPVKLDVVRFLREVVARLSCPNGHEWIDSSVKLRFAIDDRTR